MNLGDNPISSNMELSFPPFSPPKSRESLLSPHPDFEVTGMGGVYPADHFAVSVKSRHAVVGQSAVSTAVTHSALKSPPRRLAPILDRRSRPSTRAPISTQILAVKRVDHAPSKLPPASCYMPSGADSMSDDDSDTEESASTLPEINHNLMPSTAPQLMGFTDIRSDVSDTDMDDADDDSDDESDGSLDLLAAARKLDPEAVRQQEREYDAIMADRLAEEIPAGSSAATAGGGSGFASPVAQVAEMQYQQAVREARNLKR